MTQEDLNKLSKQEVLEVEGHDRVCHGKEFEMYYQAGFKKALELVLNNYQMICYKTKLVHSNTDDLMSELNLDDKDV